MQTLQRYGKKDAGDSPSSYDIVDNLSMQYIGNQLIKVHDTGINVLINESMDFKDHTNGNGAYAYNQNGAMIKDTHKGISSIQYNYLNLPTAIEIANPQTKGHIKYLYSAAGNKLRTIHQTDRTTLSAPVAAVTTYSTGQTTNKTTDYVGNKIYEDNTLKRILINGGYIENNTYHFNITDHLGNNRVVANASGTVIQKNHYYPFGMSFAETSTAEQGKQPYKYNGKELDQAHGLNLYDYSARYKDDWRFTTVDPMAEKYYSWSPYAYVMNNPLKYIDPDGCSTHTDSLGNIVAVYNDGNMGVYRHKISASAYEGEELKIKNGEKMGETYYWDEFISPESNEIFGTIQFGKSFDRIIKEAHEKSEDMNLIEIAEASRGNGEFDIKKDYVNVGALLNGKYVSSRSAGNFLAGYNASTGTYFGVGISFETFQKLAGALHIQESKGKRLTFGQKVDIVTGITGPLLYLGPTYQAPLWGEQKYQYRMSKMGWNYGKK